MSPQDRGMPAKHMYLGRVKAPAPRVAVAREKAEEVMDPGLSISNFDGVGLTVLDGIVLSPDSEPLGDEDMGKNRI